MDISHPLSLKIIEQCGLKETWTDGDALCNALRSYLSDEISKNEVANSFPKCVIGRNWANVTASNKSLLAFARRLLQFHEAALVRKRVRQQRIKGRHKSFYEYKILF